MKPIWYFVGLILLVMGVIIFLTGIYLFINKSPQDTILSETYPNLWWGGIMVISGGLFVIKTKNVRV